MKQLFVLYITFLFLPSCIAQPSDLLILKKNSRTFQTFFPGSNINFFTATSAYNAYITSVHHDSLFLVQYDIRQIPTNLGVYILDTVGIYKFAVYYKDIVGFGKNNNRKFNWSGSGSALLGGGILLTTVGLGTWVFTKPNTRYYASPYLVGSSALLAGIGYLLSKSTGKGIIIGKKYSLEYVSVQ